MTLLLCDQSPFMIFQSLASALAYVRRLPAAIRGRLSFAPYAGPALSR